MRARTRSIRDLSRILAQLAATFPSGFAVVCFSGRVCAANDHALSLLGADPAGRLADDAVGVSVRTLLGRVVAAEPFVESYTVLRRHGHVALHLVALRIDNEHAGLLVRAEVARNDGGFRELVDRFGLTAVEARLALRVHEGLSNASIAAAFGISVGAVNTRLCRLYERLGVRGRARLAQLVERARGPDRLVARPQSDCGEGLRLDHPLVPVFLGGTRIGLAILDADRRWVWTNPLARTLTDRLTTPEIELVVAGQREQLLARLGLRAQTWTIDGTLLGLKIDAARRRAADRENWLIEHIGLSPQEARVAVAVVAGASHAELALALGVREASVRVVCAAIHAKLGVHDRTAMVLALSRLPAYCTE